MKNFLSILIILLTFTAHSYSKSFEWIKTEKMYTNANQLIHTKEFVDFLKKNITSKKISLGMSRGKKTPLIDSFLDVLGGPPDDAVYTKDRRYFFTSACRYQSCSEKGFLFIDTKKKITIGLIRHFFIDGSKFNDVGDFLIFSKNHKSFDELPKIFTQMVKYWITTSHMNNLPRKVRFIGSNDKINDVTNNQNADFNFDSLFEDYSIMLEEGNNSVMFTYRYPSYFNSPYLIEIYDYDMFEFNRIAYINAENYKTPFFIQPSNLKIKDDFKSLMQPKYQIDNVKYDYKEGNNKQIIKIKSLNTKKDTAKIYNIIDGYFKNKNELTATILSGGVYASSKFLPVTDVKQLKDLFKNNPQTFCKLVSERRISGKKNRELNSDMKSLLLNEIKKCDDEMIIINISSNQFLNKNRLNFLPNLMCSKFSKNGEVVRTVPFDLSMNNYKNIKISSSNVRFNFSEDKYFFLANFDRFTNKLSLLKFSDSNHINIKDSIKLSCKDEYEITDRIVKKSEINIAWKVDGKFIIPECFETVWISGDNYQEFYKQYIEKDGTAELGNKKFQKFIVNIGTYLNKEILLNNSIDPGWSGVSSISLTKSLKGCLSDKPHTDVIYNITNLNNGVKRTVQNKIRYEVLEDYDLNIGKKLAPNIKQEFESIKKIRITELGGESSGDTSYNTTTYGLISNGGEKVLIPLKNHIKF